MPVYLFTYHAYGSWLPDRKRGYTRKKQGVLPPDPVMAKHYREKMSQSPASFSTSIQKIQIEELIIACDCQCYELRAVATDSSHLHVLVSWRSTRSWRRVRSGLQHSLSRRLNQDVCKRTWFVAHPSRKRVKDRQHYNYLLSTYLPDHRGWKWDRRRGAYR